jgi:hypothetical protein
MPDLIRHPCLPVPHLAAIPRTGRPCRAPRRSAAPTEPALPGFAAASHNSLRALRPLRSDRCDESVHDARLKRARPQNRSAQAPCLIARHSLPARGFAGMGWQASATPSPLKAQVPRRASYKGQPGKFILKLVARRLVVIDIDATLLVSNNQFTIDSSDSGIDFLISVSSPL